MTRDYKKLAESVHAPHNRYADVRPDEDDRLPCDDEPYPWGWVIVTGLLCATLFTLAGFGIYHLTVERRPWKPSDISIQDLRGAAKYQASESLR